MEYDKDKNGYLIADARTKGRLIKLLEATAGYDDLAALLSGSGNNGGRICSPADLADLLIPMIGEKDQEHLVVVSVDNRANVISTETVYIGTVNTAVVRVAEIMRRVISNGAVSFFVAHNHPSGDPNPSPEDVATTRRIIEAGKLLDCQLVDHIVIGKGGKYISLKSKGLAFS